MRLRLVEHVIGSLGGGSYQRRGNRLSHHDRGNYRSHDWSRSRRRGVELDARRRSFQTFEAAFRQILLGGEILLFRQRAGHAHVFLGLLLCFAATRQQQQQEQQNHSTATHQTQQDRIGQQFVEGFLVFGNRFRRDHWLDDWRFSRWCNGGLWRRRCVCRSSWRGGGQLSRDCRHRRCGRIGGRRSARAFSLQFCQLIVLQLDQLLQLVQLTLQIRHAAFQFLVVTTGRVEAFLSHRELVAQCLGITCRAFAARLGALSGDQAQIVLGVLCCTGVTATTVGRIELLLTSARFGHITTALTPGFVLRSDFGNRFRLRQCRALHRIRQTQHLAGFQAVDVATDECIRVQRLNGQHGLLHRAAGTRLRGDFPQGIARRGGVLGRFGRTGDGRGNR
ncbi:hypothetical protein D3C72_955190 [compost metagenome]